MAMLSSVFSCLSFRMRRLRAIVHGIDLMFLTLFFHSFLSCITLRCSEGAPCALHFCLLILFVSSGCFVLCFPPGSMFFMARLHDRHESFSGIMSLFVGGDIVSAKVSAVGSHVCFSVYICFGFVGLPSVSHTDCLGLGCVLGTEGGARS